MAPADVDRDEMTEGREQKQRTKRTWGTGSYPTFGRHFLPTISRLVERAPVEPGDRVLDVACGHGNVALTANRRGGRVVGLDLSPAMLDLARENAAMAGTDAVEWHVGDAEQLPYSDRSFDVVVSNVGHVLAPNPDAAGSEMARVTTPGGRIAFTAWTPDGPLPSVFDALADYLPPRPDAPPSPARWSDPAAVRERLGDPVEDVEFQTGAVPVPAVSVGGFWAFLVECSGALQDTLGGIDDGERDAAHEAVASALEPYFDGSENVMRLEYRLVTATRS